MFPDAAAKIGVSRIREFVASRIDLEEIDADERTALFSVGRIGNLEKEALDSVCAELRG